MRHCLSPKRLYEQPTDAGALDLLGAGELARVDDDASRPSTAPGGTRSGVGSRRCRTPSGRRSPDDDLA